MASTESSLFRPIRKSRLQHLQQSGNQSKQHTHELAAPFRFD